MKFNFAILFAINLICTASSFSQKKRSGGDNGEEAESTLPHLPELGQGQLGQLTGGGGLGSLTNGLGLGGLTSGLGGLTGKGKGGGMQGSCNCPEKVEPVCASNGKTYDSECMFQCEMNMGNKPKAKKSKSSKKTKIIKKGRCSSDSPSGSRSKPKSG